MKQGWLSRKGIFYECDPCEHQKLAYELCRKYCYTSNIALSAGNILENNGWVKIIYSYMTHEFVIKGLDSASDMQIEYLKYHKFIVTAKNTPPSTK